MPLVPLAAAVFAVFLKGSDVFVLDLTKAQKEPIEICREQRRYPIYIASNYPQSFKGTLDGSEMFVIGYDETQGGLIYFSADADPSHRSPPSVADVQKVVGEISNLAPNQGSRLDVGPDVNAHGPVSTAKSERGGTVTSLWKFIGKLRPGGAECTAAGRLRAMFQGLQLKSKKVALGDGLKDIHEAVSPDYELLVYSKALKQDVEGLFGFALYSPKRGSAVVPSGRAISDAPSVCLNVSYTPMAQMEEQIRRVQEDSSDPDPRPPGGAACYRSPCPWPK